MRVLIMSDMEGISGIVTWDQVTAGGEMYFEGRELYTDDVNAAISGAVLAGADEIVVVDCHGAGGERSFNSLVPERLDLQCQWVAHHPWTAYTEFLEQGCDACLLVGMHARAGTPDGVLCHTVSTTTWRNLWFNDDLVGETAINAALCGHFGCPVVFVSGDAAACRQSRELLGDSLVTATVKHGLSRYSARLLPPHVARLEIKDGVTAALEAVSAGRYPPPYIPARPTTITIEIDTVDHTAQFAHRHGVEIVDALKVVSRGADWLQAWRQVWG